MSTPGFFVRRLSRPAFRAGAFTLAEMLVAMGIFSLTTLGIWETIRTVFFLSAKNTGVNLSHTALQMGVDQLAEQLRSSLQIVDVANFNGTTFTHIDETAAAGASAAGNAVRFVRCMPVTLYLLPDDGSGYTQSNPQNPQSLLYPDYLTKGNKTVKATFNTATSNLSNANFLADLRGARLCPRFPFLTETLTTGSSPGTLPGLTLASTPTLTAGSTATFSLTYGLPTTASVASCNQAYLVVISAAAVINRGTAYSELVYYPDATNLTRFNSLTVALAPSTTGNGPTAFSLPLTAGSLANPAARGSVQINLPVYAPSLNNTVGRRGGTAALVNIELSVPVETRRRAQY